MKFFNFILFFPDFIASSAMRFISKRILETNIVFTKKNILSAHASGSLAEAGILFIGASESFTGANTSSAGANKSFTGSNKWSAGANKSLTGSNKWSAGANKSFTGSKILCNQLIYK